MKFNLRRLAKENTNYILLLVLLVFAGLTLSLGKATAKSEPSRMSSTAVTISFGETVSGSISSPAEIDTFTFVGNQGDRILIGWRKGSRGYGLIINPEEVLRLEEVVC